MGIPKIPSLNYNGEYGVYCFSLFFFVVYLFENYSKYLMTCWLSCERSLPFGLLVFLSDSSDTILNRVKSNK